MNAFTDNLKLENRGNQVDTFSRNSEGVNTISVHHRSSDLQITQF